MLAKKKYKEMSVTERAIHRGHQLLAQPAELVSARELRNALILLLGTAERLLAERNAERLLAGGDE